jgi:hypothetical protein
VAAWFGKDGRAWPGVFGVAGIGRTGKIEVVGGIGRIEGIGRTGGPGFRRGGGRGG